MNKEISVIIPVYNCPDGLKDTVESLIAQDYLKEKYEVIIADNGSSDDTLAVAEDYVDRFPDLVQVVIEDKIQSSYAARNKGIDASLGDILCFIDADMTVEHNYLTHIKKRYDDGSVDYYGCKVNIYSVKDTLTSKFNIVNGFPVKSYLENHNFVPTCCLSVRRYVVEKVGAFDSRLESSGDLEFGHRVYKAGLKQGYMDDIVLHHPARWKYRSMLNKGKRIARGIAQLNYYFPDQYGYLVERYFRLRRYLPSNPIRQIKRFKDNKIHINVITALIYSVFPLPIRIVTLLELLKNVNRIKELQ